MSVPLPLMSRSGLEASLCGWRYKALYVDGMQDESDYSRRGTAHHTCKRRYVERLAAAQTPMDDEEARLAFQEGIAIARTPSQLVPEVRDIFERHVQHFALNLEAYVVAEKRHTRTDVPLPYQFEPDLVYAHHRENILEITDDKTYFHGFTEAQARKLVQTRYYVWAAMQEYPGFDTYRFTYNFVRLNQFTCVDFTADEFDELDREVHAMEAARRERHEKNLWEATPGDVCAFCNLACPVMDDPKRQRTRVNSAESFEAVGGAVLVMEKALKEMKTSLKRYCTINGAQDVSGEVFDHRPTISRSYDAAAVVDLIRSHEKIPAMRVSASSLKADLKAIPTLAKELAPIETVKQSVRFGHKSLKKLLKERPPEEDGDDEGSDED